MTTLTRTAVRWSQTGKRAAFLLIVCLLLVPSVLAQNESTLQLSLRRDFGTGIGSSIQGKFSLRAEGPADLTRVMFLIDGETMAEVTTPPFRYQFHTDAYSPGVHTFSAVGYTAVGQELTSNTITRNILTGSESTRATLWIIIPILVLIVGGQLLFYFITRRGKTKNGQDLAIDGLFGGTICPKCKRPFARHWWGLNIGVGKYDRCPHCHKWSIVRSVHPDILAASAQAMKQADAQNGSLPTLDDEEVQRRRLDDSRFDN